MDRQDLNSSRCVAGQQVFQDLAVNVVSWRPVADQQVWADLSTQAGDDGSEPRELSECEKLVVELVAMLDPCLSGPP